MRTASYKSVLEGTLRLCGLDPATTTTIEAMAVVEFIGVRLRQAWEYWRWPECTITESRYFRDVWAAASYNLGSEVYHPGTDAYWQANANLILTDVPGVSAKWTALTVFTRYVAYAQTGQTEIEAMLGAWEADPRANERPPELFFKADTDGFLFATNAPNQVWVEYRSRCPDFRWSAEWSAIAFSAKTIVYHSDSGEIYKANADAADTDIPGTSDKWDVISVPYFASDAVKRGATADWLESDGQDEKFALHDNKFDELIDDQVWQYTKLQGQTGRPSRRSR